MGLVCLNRRSPVAFGGREICARLGCGPRPLHELGAFELVGRDREGVLDEGQRLGGRIEAGGAFGRGA